MIILKNNNGKKHYMQYVVASGALAFDGLGWPWERPLVGMGLIKPELFTVFIKSLTLNPLKGNLSMLHPWTCIRSITGGTVNRVGLTGPGVDKWCEEIAPTIDFEKYSLGASLFGTREELLQMVPRMNKYPFKALEVNDSCPNTGHDMATQAESMIGTGRQVSRLTHHALIYKLSVVQPYLEIARGLKGYAQAISLNSVPWSTVFPDKRSPLWRLEKKLKGGGGGGVSGRPAQRHNWQAVKELASDGSLPVIGPSIMEYDDLDKLEELGAQAFSFGAIHIMTKNRPWTAFTNPIKPTRIVQKHQLNSR